MVRVFSRARSARRVRFAAAVLGLALLLSACSDDQPDAAAGGTAAPGSSGSSSAAPDSAGTSTPAATGTKKGAVEPSGPPPVDTQPPAVAITAAPAVDVGTTTAFSNGVKVRVSKLTQVKVKASGPGDIAGDGVAVHLTVKNSSRKKFNLNGIAVTASYGQDQPASPAGSGNGKLLAGSLAVGEKASGVYVFTVPKAEASSVRVEVSSDASALIVVYER
jgi:hypothetical protein